MRKMIEDSIGIDVSKLWLDAHRLSTGEAARFANDSDGHAALVRWIGSGPVARVVFEPTGRYHREMEHRLAAAGLPLVKVNPRHARRFAEALGARAKTDRADAGMLARMGAALDLEPRAERSESLSELNDLLAARRALVKDRTAAKNRAKGLSLPLLRRQNTARLRRIEADLAAIDAAVATLIAADPDLAGRHAILRSIPGLGDVTAAALLALAPELGALDQRQIASLAGLAPITRQSGNWRGKAFIRGGRALLREALYMPALVAIQHNADAKRVFQRLTENGKAAKLALTAVMRKLIILANALLRDRRKWAPKAG
jgi:transposase